MEEWKWKAGFPNFLSIVFSNKTNQIFLVLLYDDKSEAATTKWGGKSFYDNEVSQPNSDQEKFASINCYF